MVSEDCPLFNLPAGVARSEIREVVSGPRAPDALTGTAATVVGRLTAGTGSGVATGSLGVAGPRSAAWLALGCVWATLRDRSSASDAAALVSAAALVDALTRNALLVETDASAANRFNVEVTALAWAADTAELNADALSTSEVKTDSLTKAALRILVDSRALVSAESLALPCSESDTETAAETESTTLSEVLTLTSAAIDRLVATLPCTLRRNESSSRV